jgi:hypothetical protein
MAVEQESELQSLKSENRHLRELIVSLSARLLRDAAVALSEPHHTATADDAERLLREAEDCFRCARIAGLRQQIAGALEVAGYELMAKAVEIESLLERAKRDK